MPKASVPPPARAAEQVEIGPVKGNAVTILALLVGAALGIIVCYFFLSNQPWWNAPLIGNAVQATLAAQPTSAPLPTLAPLPSHTPWPTLTPWPTYTPAPAVSAVPSPAAPSPAPIAHIVKPDFIDGRVAVQTNAIVTFANIPADHFLWVVVTVPQVQPRLQVYPQLLKGVPSMVSGSGTLELPVQFGQDRPQDSGAPFNLVALLLDAANQQRFLQYAQGCIAQPTAAGMCGGLNLPNAGVQILDFSTVIRQ